MKSTVIGLALALAGGAALAQTPPPPSPPPAVKQPTAGPSSVTPPSQPADPQGQMQAKGDRPAMPAPSGPPEGMIVETPNGFFLVRPGGEPPRRLEFGHAAVGQAEGAAAGESGETAPDGPEGGAPQPPRRPHGPPPHPPEGKGAHLHVHTPNLDLDVKCPDDEPVKACVDAVSQLLDKAGTGH